jgi:hypothetical protein
MASIVPIAMGAAQIIDNLNKEAKLKEESQAVMAARPIKRTSQFLNDSLSLAESELSNGMSAAGEKAYNDATDRSLASSISALLKSGGNVNSIGEIYSGTEQGRQNLAILQDQMRLNHIAGVLKAYDTIAAEEEKNWMVNEYAPFKDKLQAIGQQRQNAAQAKIAGWNTLGNGAMTLLGSDQGIRGSNERTTPTTQLPELTGNGYSTPAVPIGYSTTQPSSLSPNNYNFLTAQPDDSSWSNFWNTFQIKI